MPWHPRTRTPPYTSSHLRTRPHTSTHTLTHPLTPLHTPISGFLVEGKIQKLLEPLPPDEQNLLKIDSILKVLTLPLPLP